MIMARSHRQRHAARWWPPNDEAHTTIHRRHRVVSGVNSTSIGLLVAVAVSVSIQTLSAADQMTPPRPAHAPLWQAFSRPASEVEDLDASLAVLNADVLPAVEQRLDFARRYKPTLTVSPKLAGDEISIATTRRGIERAIAGLAGSADVRAEAVLFAQTAVLFYEWEGESDGPLSEARFAEEYLRENPQTRIGSFLDLFLLHRYRAAFEAAEVEGNAEAKELAAERYARVWQRVQQIHDIVVQAVANDIDGAEYLYLKTPHHPRTSGR